MNKEKAKKVLILALAILFFCLLCLLIFLLREVEKENNTVDVSTETRDNEEEPETAQEVMQKYDSKHIKKDDEENTIYATLSKDLYDEDGSSNEKFIYDLVEELEPFYNEEDFKIIDQNRKILIEADYNRDKEEHEIIINGVHDFYDKTDGDTYNAVENSQIVKGTNFAVTEYVLNKLQVYSGYFSHIEEELGEGKDLGNGYTSYKDGKIKIRLAGTGAVRNIIYDNSYETYITDKIHNQMSLREIKELEPENDFGSLKDGYLGYRQQDYYVFFYPDEVSVYTYSYKENDVFEWALLEYLQDKNLELFVDRIKRKWQVYDKLEYDSETQSAYILISNRGVEIDIKENNPKGIKLYSNYYFTDFTKRMAKSGFVSFEADTDLLDKVERDRRNSD